MAKLRYHNLLHEFDLSHFLPKTRSPVGRIPNAVKYMIQNSTESTKELAKRTTLKPEIVAFIRDNPMKEPKPTAVQYERAIHWMNQDIVPYNKSWINTKRVPHVGSKPKIYDDGLIRGRFPNLLVWYIRFIELERLSTKQIAEKYHTTYSKIREIQIRKIKKHITENWTPSKDDIEYANYWLSLIPRVGF